MANGIVWHFGPELDHALTNPVVLQGHDTAENVLYEIKFGGVQYGDFPYCFIARPDGRILVGLNDLNNTYKTPDDHFRMYHQEGYRIDFPNLHGAIIRCIYEDSTGNIYIGGDENISDNHYIFRKYDSSGTLLWSKKSRTIDDTTGKSVRRIAVDSSGYLYVSVRSQYSELSKYHPDGTHQWTQVIKSQSGISGGQFVVIDSSDNIFVAGDSSVGYYQDELYDVFYPVYNFTYYDESTYSGGNHQSYNITKWDTDGNFIYGFDAVSTTCWDIKIVNSYIYVLSSNSGFLKLDSSLTQYSFTGPSFNIPPYPSFSWFDINPDDETVYTANYYNPLGVKFTDQTTMPALPIPIYLGKPTWYGDRYTSIPALPIYLALAAPKVIREYAGAFPLATVYRLYLTGGTGTVELPMASFTCRRGYGVLSITAICPGLSDTQIQQVIDRTAGTLIIKRGIRLRDGTEQLDEILAAPMDETTPYRWDAGSSRASASLNAKDTAEIANPKTRTVRGVSYRNLSDGRRRARCAVDTYLQPGDTADLGGEETMIVAEITYSVSPTREVMEIAEASS